MFSVDNELKYLRELVKSQELLMEYQKNEIEKQKNKIEIQKSKIEEQKNEIEDLNLQIEKLIQAIRQGKKKIFGRSTEVTPLAEQLGLFKNDDPTNQIPNIEQLMDEIKNSQKEIVINAYKRKARQPGVREDMIANLPVEIINCDLDPSEYPNMEKELIKVGTKLVRTEVVYTPASLKVVRYMQNVYKIIPKNEEEKLTDKFIATAIPQSLLPHSLASASTVAQIIYQKYDMGVPLNRQERYWYDMGLELYRSTMANWVIRCSEEWLTPIYNRIHQYMLCLEVVHGDETRIQCNKEPGRKASSNSFMWVMRTIQEEKHQAVLFYYSRTRSGAEAQKLYNGFKGCLITDAYIGYEAIDGINRALCWSHVRRYYIDSIPLNSNGKEIPGSKGAEGRAWCNKLFEIERKIQGLEPLDKVARRLELSKPVLEGFWSWVKETSAMHTTNDALKKALNYSLNQREYLETFLEDGRIPISNNFCEAAIRPFATGRRAWLFADSPKGATSSAVIYSLVETAKANGLDVFHYIQYLLEVMPQTDFHIHPELLDSYLPWSKSLPDICKIPANKRKESQKNRVSKQREHV